MNLRQTLLVIGCMAVITMATRFLPFVFFRNSHVPSWLRRVGGETPPLIIGLLVLYCLKDVRWNQSPFGVPELVAALVTAGLQFWIGRALVSILVGTGLYMLLLVLWN